MNMARVLTLVLLLPLTLFPLQGMAQEEKEVVELEKVVVVAPPIKLGPTSTIVDVDKFPTTGHRETILDILSHMGSIHVQRRSLTSPDPEEVIGMRGMDDSRLAIYVDGRPIVTNDTIHDWASQTLDFIDKIEVVRGGASALYGNSLGGVINITTKRPKKPETLKPHIEVYNDWSAYNTHSHKAHISGGIGPVLYRSAVNRRLSNGFLRNNDFDAWDFRNELTLLLPNEGTFSFAWRLSDLQRGQAVINDPNDPVAGPAYDPNYPIVPRNADLFKWHPGLMPNPGGNSRLFVTINYFDVIVRQPIWNGMLKLNAYTNRKNLDDFYYASQGTTDLPIQRLQGGNIYNDQTIGMVSQYQFFPHPDHDVTVGFDWRTIGIEPNPANNIRTILTPYLEDVWRATRTITVRAGVRWSHLRESNWWSPEWMRTVRYTEWQPKFMFSWKFIPQTEGYVSVNRAFREEGGC